MHIHAGLYTSCYAVPTERVQCIQVRAGETGHSYSTVFSTCMDGNVESIAVSDPYIRARHQLHNFVRFCELAVKSCHKLKTISLTTGREPQNEVNSSLSLSSPGEVAAAPLPVCLLLNRNFFGILLITLRMCI